MHRMVFTQILYKLTLAAFCCSLASGCVSYRKVKIEMLEPAEITLRENSVLAYLDRNIIYKPDTLPPLWNIRKQVPKVFGEGLNSGLFYAEPADTAVIMEEKKSSYYRGMFPPPLNAEILTKLNKKLGVDYIISLECHYLDRKEHKNFYSWFVRLYDAHSGESADSLVMSSKISNSKDIFTVQDDALQKTWDKGLEYAGRITPHWKESERRLYRSGKYVRTGYIFYKAERLDEAIEIWSVARQASTMQAIKAGLNLAWVYENAGDIEQALQILKETKQIAENENLDNKTTVYLNDYLKIIEKRTEQIKKLDEQIKKDSDDEQF